MNKEYPIWHPFAPLKGAWPIEELDSAKGVELKLTNGKILIDAISSWWVNIHGHGNEKLAKAVYDQILKLDHVIFSGFTHQPAQQLAEELMKILPKNQKKLFFSDDGSTAVEVAVKLALQYFYNRDEKRNKIISIKGAYHGDTFGAMSVSADEGFYAPFTDLMFKVDQVAFPDGNNDAEVIEDFEKKVSNQAYVAFVYEPLLQGAAGMRMYSPETLNKLMEIAHQYGVFCVADEVLTGFGRTGKYFASDYMTEKPDLVCMSKALTGGILPLGITSCAQSIIDAFDNDRVDQAFYHGHSFTGNPVSCAAALQSTKMLQEDSCQKNIKRIEKSHIDFANRIKKHPKLNDVRTLGVCIALEINTGTETSYFNNLRRVLYDFFISKGLLLRPLGNVVYIYPPYIILDSELKKCYDAIEEALDNVV